MHDLPRRKLIEIVTHRQTVTTRTGRDVLSDAKLCEALLRDLCGEYKREIFVLVAAQKERVAAELLASQNGVPREVLFTRLSRRLMDNLALTEDAAQWAVDSWALALGFELPQPTAPQTVTPPAVTPPAAGPYIPTPTIQRTALPVDFEPAMILIPAGEFWMGDTSARDNEMARHRVYLDEYAIGIAPVTQAQYLKFVNATNHRMPADWDQKQKTPSPNKLNHPVVKVDWNDATAYCHWLAQVTGNPYRLPSEAEWEKAARGTDARVYPWGNAAPDATRLNYNRIVGGTTEVGSYPSGASPYGVLDMAGNVCEWVADWYSEKNYVYASSADRNPAGPNSGSYHVLRGGSWVYSASSVRAPYRNWLPSDYQSDYIGFRCAR